MENSENCLRRAEADREAAGACTLPRERERFEQSAERWEEMAVRSQRFEHEKEVDTLRREENKLLAQTIRPLPKDPKSARNRLVNLLQSGAAATQ